MRTIYLLAATVLVTLPAAALAHEGHDSTLNFLTGFAHPFSGLDHSIAAAGVGMLGMLRARTPRQGLVYPFVFLTAAALGFVLGQAGGTASMLDPSISLSTALLLVFLWYARPSPSFVAIAAIVVVGLGHGVVHADVVRDEPGWAEFGAGALSGLLLLAAAGGLAGAILGRFGVTFERVSRSSQRR